MSGLQVANAIRIGDLDFEFVSVELMSPLRVGN